jgi:hypothetical protein
VSLEPEQLVVDAHPARPFQEDVELGLLPVTVACGCLPGRQAPQARAEGVDLELLGQVGVVDAHLIRGAPEGVTCGQHAVGHSGLLAVERT